MSIIEGGPNKNRQEQEILEIEPSLEEWLHLMKNRPKGVKFIDYQFPNESLKKIFMGRICEFPDETIRMIISSFLRMSPILAHDDINLEFFLSLKNKDPKSAAEIFARDPYWRRLLLFKITDGKIPVRDGITWIVDILDEYPMLALKVLEAYFLAHAHSLPDGRIMGLLDSITIIRARNHSLQHPTKILLSLDPYQFEFLVAGLFHEMGYKTRLTRKTYDGGRDIIAEKKGPGVRQRSLIQCKKTEKNVGVEMLRSLLGVVSSEKATRGILVTTGEFTASAKRFSRQNTRLDIVGHRALQVRLNQYFGSSWPLRLDYLISNSFKKHGNKPRGQRA